MKLERYLVEREETVLEYGPPLWQKLWKNCKPFLKELDKTGLAGKRFIWRGSNARVKSKPGIKEIIPRGDRQPKDMPYELHQEFDNMFYNRFNWYARSEGVFTTSKRSTATGYGAAYLFFPTGHYSYLWSPDIEDLYSFTDSENLDSFGYHDYEGYYDSWEDEWRGQFGEGADGYWEYEGEQVGGFGIDRYEAEDAAEDVFGEDPNYDPGLLTWIPDEDFNDWIYSKEQEFRDQQENVMWDAVKGYKSKNLKNAIKYGHEIMFNCESYYLVHQAFDNFLSEMLQRGTYQLKLPFPPFGTTSPPTYWAYNKKGNMVYSG